MELLTLNKNHLEKKGGLHTADEINSQPELWQQVSEKFSKAVQNIEPFLKAAYAEADEIILTGAGTSSFIGLSLQSSFYKNTHIITRAISTTDIVSHPHSYFSKQATLLIISFARSGNSPESCAALELADKLSKKCFHLIITCNKNGALAGYTTHNPAFTFLMPEAANDKGLAMTGSYTAMLLAGLMTAYIYHPEKSRNQLQLVMKAATNILLQAEVVYKVAAKKFRRAVFLGSGPLFGTAKEAALKLQELTDGKIVCKSDTYLGLRHGPKAVVDENTLVVYFLNNNDYAKRYEHDLINVMNNGNNAMYQLLISENFEPLNDVDAQINFSAGEEIEEDFLPVCEVIVGQLLGFYKSLDYGLMPDQPSVSGSITRVVEGVTIYPLETKASVNYEL